MWNAYRDKSNNLFAKTRFLYLIDSITYSSFGIFLLLVWPLIKIAPVLFGAFWGFFAIINGISVFIAFYRYRKEPYFKAILSKGCISTLAGLFILIWPKDISEQALILFIASWLFAKGTLHFYIPVKYKKKYKSFTGWIYYSIGTLELAFGFFLLFSLKSHSFPLIWSVAIYFIFTGIVIFVAFLMRKRVTDPIVKAV